MQEQPRMLLVTIATGLQTPKLSLHVAWTTDDGCGFRSYDLLEIAAGADPRARLTQSRDCWP